MPVIAWRRGSVPEVIDDALTGFIVDDVEQAAQAVYQLERLDRRTCRRVFETRFNARRMATDYVDLYQRVIAATR